MGLVCRSCGTENRDKARFCVGCAAPLIPGPPEVSPRRTRSARAGSQGDHETTAVRSSAARWIGIGVVGAVILVSAIVWTLRPVATPSSPNGVPTPTPGVQAAVPNGTPAGGQNSLAEATAAAEARLQASLQRLAREDAEREEMHRQEREVAARRLQAEQARRSAARAKDAPATQAEAPAPAAPLAAVPEPAPASTSTPSRPAPVATVEQRCSEAGNLFSRSACQARVCADPSLAQDPVCRRLREIEQTNRRDPTYLN